MDSNIKVSVVVPVYNIEKYLSQCLDSLVNQTLKDIEIICVNDESTDSSLAILEEYAAKDSRIQIISQKNKGLSGARNTGMKYIRGQYTFFVDSDDWIDLNALEELYNKISKLDADILMYQMMVYDEDNDEFILNQYGSLEAIDESFDNKIFNYRDVSNILFKIAHSPVNKLYNSKFLKSLNVEFPEGFNYEDVLFFFKVFLKAQKVAILRKPFYFYRTREGSISTKADAKAYDIFYILKNSQEIIQKTGILETNLQDFLMYLIVNFKFVYSSVDENYRDGFLELLKKEYQNFSLDKVDKSFDGWHYTDRAFYEGILPADNFREFELIREVEEYKFLTNHYKTMAEELQNRINLQNNESKSLKSKFKNILK